MFVLSIGQCGFDNSQISQVLGKCDAKSIPLDKGSEITGAIEKYKPNLILLNRIFDKTQESGLEIIKKLKLEPLADKIPIMLVSNYPEAQAEAVKLGAEQGFGKSDLGSAHVIEMITKALS